MVYMSNSLHMLHEILVFIEVKLQLLCRNILPTYKYEYLASYAEDTG
jgi:hypothetical protein